MSEPCACYFNYPHLQLLQFQSILDKFSVKYIIGLEHSTEKKKPHFQCIIYWDIDRPRKNYWLCFKDSIFRSLGKLSGKNNEFGKVDKKIRDQTRLCSYCLKEGNYFTKGFKKSQIKELYNASFIRGDAKSRSLQKKMQLDVLCESINKAFRSHKSCDTTDPEIFEKYYIFVFNYCSEKKQKMISKHRLLSEAFRNGFIRYILYARNMGITFHTTFM